MKLHIQRYELEPFLKRIIIGDTKRIVHMAGMVRQNRTFFGRRQAPCRNVIQELVEKFELLGQVSDVKNKTRARRSRTAENIAAIAESVEENLGLFIPRRTLELGVPQTSIYRPLHKDVGLKAY